MYFNYAFTAIWAADVVWLWLNPVSYRRRAGWLAGSVHAFMAFMFFNGAVVFAGGWMRWFSLTVTAAITGLWIREWHQRHGALSGSTANGRRAGGIL